MMRVLLILLGVLALVAPAQAQERIPPTAPVEPCPTRGILVANPYPPDQRRFDVYWKPGSGCREAWIVLSVRATDGRYRVYQDGRVIADIEGIDYPNIYTPVAASPLAASYELRQVTGAGDVLIDGPAFLPAARLRFALVAR